MPAACERKWTCMIEAPASKASCAERAICAGETGTIGCWRGSVRTPFRAQVKIALDIGGLIQFLDFEEKCGVRDLPTLTNAHARHTAGVDSYNAGFHLHSFDQCEGLPRFNQLPRLNENFNEQSRNWSNNPAAIQNSIL